MAALRWRMKLSRAIQEFLHERQATGSPASTIAAYGSDLHRLVGLSFAEYAIEGTTYPGSLRSVGKGGRTVVLAMHPDLKEILYNYVLASTDLKPSSYVLTQRRNGRPYRRKLIERMCHAWGRA